VSDLALGAISLGILILIAVVIVTAGWVSTWGDREMSEFEFGNPKVNDAGFNCCGKPRGCTMTHEGCAYLQHPWKRAMLFNDTTARCQMMSMSENGDMQCRLPHLHSGVCEMVPVKGGESVKTH
jgi:hypothetical protein